MIGALQNNHAANGTQPALLVGVSYTFNRPK